MKNRLFSIAAVAAMVGVAACGGADEAATVDGDAQVVDQNTEMVTTSDTTMAPVVAPVVTTDTAAVQTTTVVEADTMTTTEVVDPATVTPTP